MITFVCEKCEERTEYVFVSGTKDIRPFTDLITEIEIDNEVFVPIQKIAALCFNYNEEVVKNKAKMWVNESYDMRAWFTFETNILKPKNHQCSVAIDRNFDITIYHKVNQESSNTGMSPSNQVGIFKNLIKWGFIN